MAMPIRKNKFSFQKTDLKPVAYLAAIISIIKYSKYGV